MSCIGIYIGIYYIYGGDKQYASLLGGYGRTIFGLWGVASAPLAAWARNFWSIIKTLVGIMGQVLLGFATTWIFYMPRHPCWQFIPL